MAQISAIEVVNISKKYRYGTQQPYYSLRDAMVRAVKHPLATFKRFRLTTDGLADDEFWALKNVSFSVKKGEIVGIIGRNGAGKSTLLKIISRITYPTEGEVRLRGRVASLLEVGTGFHPELTGRENIYLNSAILGMRRSEIKRKMAKIIEFAEIEKFIDSPVKHYSSGMYTRLAFSVSAHLESEILIIDEVLSVGDVAFQKKCLDKIGEIGSFGRTVLFVSHSVQAVSNLSERVLLFSEGRLVEDGASSSVIRKYLGSKKHLAAKRQWTDPRRAPGNEVVRLTKILIKNNHGRIASSFDLHTPVYIEITYNVQIDGSYLVPSVQLINDQGMGIFGSNDTDRTWNKTARELSTYTSTVEIPGNLLSDGDYSVRVVIATFIPYQKHINEYDVVAFHIKDVGGPGTARGEYLGTMPGFVRPYLKWNTKMLD